MQNIKCYIVVCFFISLWSLPIYGQITVDFVADVTESCISAQSTFTDLSKSTEGNIVSWNWDLGGVSSDLENPGRIFAVQDGYEICLTVTDSKGNSASLCKKDYINVYGSPIADFDASTTSGCLPLTVDFEDLSQSPNGEIVNWTWGLGGTNGIISTSSVNKNINTTYNQADQYSISLSIEDEKGCKHSVTKNDLINSIGKPEIDVNTVEAIGCAFPMMVDFENYGEEESVTYQWNFGNGDTFDGFNPGPVTYNSEGSYDVTVIATNTVSLCADTLVLSDYINTGGTIQFDFYPKQGCRNLPVQFEDLSPIEADTWEWDFGDGQTSTDRDPTHTYKLPGKYNISLSRTTSDCSGMQISNYVVEVTENPTIDFAIDQTESCHLPGEVSFEASGNPNNIYRWYIGAPGAYEVVLTDQEVSHEFDSYGNREVRLQVTSELGCRSTKLVDTLQILPLEVKVVGNNEGCIPFVANLGITSNLDSPLSNIQWTLIGPDTIRVSDSHLNINVDSISSFDLQVVVENEVGCVDTLYEYDFLRGGEAPSVDFAISDTVFCPQESISLFNLSSQDVNSWNWTVGDSTFFEEESPVFTMSSPGSFDVSVLVGNNGCFAYKEVEDLFVINPPGGRFELVYNCEDPFLVKAKSLASGHDSLSWMYVIGSDTINIANEDSINISFPGREEYLVTMKAMNFEFGCETSNTDTVKITAPKAAFDVSMTEGCAPLVIDFSDESEDAVSYQYFTEIEKFANDTLANTSIRIRYPGEYTDIGLVVTDMHGCTDTTYAPTIRVNAVDAQFLTPDPVCIADTLVIENSSSSMFSNVISNVWTLGEDLDTSTLVDAIFSLDEIGKHNVKLVVEDDWGCKDSITNGLSAYFRGPNFELVADSLSCTTHELQFRNKFHAASYNYEWDFGDGNSSTEINPSHLYAIEGDYPLSLTITDDESCVNEIPLVQLIQIADPIASFTADSTFAPCPPLVTTFDNSSLNGITYNWDFGDQSGQSTEFDPAHLYTLAGVFDVALIVERTAFCKDTLVISDLIQLDGPKGEFTFEVDSSCVPLSVEFEAILAEEYTLTWDFGDGNLQPIDEKVDYNKVQYSYLEPGDFIPKIILEDNANCKISREGENIQTHELIAEFESGDSIFCNAIPSSIILSDLSHSTSPIIGRSWNVAGEELQGDDAQYFVPDTGRFDVSLIVSNAFCSDTIVKENYLRVGDNPETLVTTDTFNCINTMLTLEISTQDEADETIWFNSNEEIVAIDVTEFAQEINENQFLIVETSNEYNCSIRDTIYVQVIDDRTEFAGPDKTICLGNATTIEIDYGSSVLWTNLDLNDCDTCRNISLEPTEAKLYTLELINEYGCQILDSLYVDVLTQDDIDAGDDQQVCFSEKPILLAYAQGQLEWSPAHLLESTTSYLTAANISESTMFHLSSKLDECILYDSVFVEVVDKAELSAIGDTVCYGEDAQLLADGLIDAVRWESNAEDISNYEIMNPTSSTRSTKNFMAIGSLGNCAPDTAYADVKVHPEIMGYLPEVRNYFKGTEEIEVRVIMTSEGSYDFNWSPAEIISCQNCEEVTVQVQDTAHWVDLEIVERESGCRDTMSVEIRQYYGCESATAGIGVPNIFSPNEDGVNDFLNIEAPAFEDITSLSIFDRWGQKVFYSTTVTDAWDGSFNGNPVLPGVYSYIISANCPDTNTDVYKSGDVTVIR